MNVAPITADQGARRTIISIDAMGGDRGPAAVVAGIARSAAKNDQISFLLHGPKDTLRPLVTKLKLSDRVEIRNADGVVQMDDKPSHVMRNG
jgi:glycerol-3-phosphate acyltransferase PlsX